MSAQNLYSLIDWSLLRSQKESLVEMANEDDRLTKEIEVLDGIISLLDGLQDDAVAQGCASEKDVFGEEIDEQDSEKKYFKTLIQVEVLSDVPLEWDDLDDVSFAITNGGCSGVVKEVARKKLTREQVEKELIKQGCDSNFFDNQE